ncbi:hypothetical protein POM88_040348 [Heracleum sosnowskyi]|uniref:Uncharacterized protein n=1 Tax=Heracleum sosnowskyi TaxID=360622 RepID=A0AAD8M9R7_9APIA|nr:hypothetical protein POM88_040348 [Heracleum sosnowskyi]
MFHDSLFMTSVYLLHRIAVYKAIYPSLGTLTDLVATIDQATLDGVDILTLSIGPDEPPDDTLTFLSIFEIFIPWAVGVAASGTDRSYFCNLILGNGQRITGVGLSDVEELCENPTLKINVEELCDNSVEEGDESDGEGGEGGEGADP